MIIVLINSAISDILIAEKNNKNDSKSCHCDNLEETIDKCKDTTNKKMQ